MRYGFTGSRHGMTARQHSIMLDILGRICGELHHGDCFGADAQAHNIAQDCGWSIVVHPPEATTLRAFVTGVAVVLPPKPYLDRNHDIVDAIN
jgi:hypothetical protein